MPKYTKDEISHDIRKIIAAKIGGKTLDDVNPEHRIGGWTSSRVGPDLGDDSMDRVEIVMGIEDEFSLDISDEDAM